MRSALVDTRSSPLLPPPPGTCFTAEFFLDELEIRDAEVEVIRTEERDNGLVLLGCKLTAQPEERTAIRAKITASLAPLRPSKGKAR